MQRQQTLFYSALCIFWTSQFPSFKLDHTMVILYFGESVRVIRRLLHVRPKNMTGTEFFLTCFCHSPAGKVFLCVCLSVAMVCFTGWGQWPDRDPLSFYYTELFRHEVLLWRLFGGFHYSGC